MFIQDTKLKMRQAPAHSFVLDIEILSMRRTQMEAEQLLIVVILPNIQNSKCVLPRVSEVVHILMSSKLKKF